MTSPNRPILDYLYSYSRLTPNSKRTTILLIGCMLSRRRKWWRAGYAHLHYRTTRALASSNRWIPSHTFSPRAQAAPPPVVGLIHNKGPAAAASLNIVITMMTTIKRMAQNTIILSLRTTEERKTMKRALPRRGKHERVWQAYLHCRTTKGITTIS